MGIKDRELGAIEADKEGESPRGFHIYYVLSSRTVCKRTPLEAPGTNSAREVLLHTVLDEGTYTVIINRKPPRGGGFFRSIPGPGVGFFLVLYNVVSFGASTPKSPWSERSPVVFVLSSVIVTSRAQKGVQGSNIVESMGISIHRSSRFFEMLSYHNASDTLDPSILENWSRFVQCLRGCESMTPNSHAPRLSHASLSGGHGCASLQGQITIDLQVHEH